MARFGAHARPLSAPRTKATGLGSKRSELVPEEAVAPETPFYPQQGFAGIRSRSRFIPPASGGVMGHGSAESATALAPPQPEPTAGRSQFSLARFATSLSDAIGKWRMSNMDLLSEALVSRGLLRYLRRREPSPITGYRPPDMIRWGEPPLPVAMRRVIFTLRREFMQDAQSFRGEHVAFTKGARSSSSPVRMSPPRTNRLTNRQLPGSFGQTTEVLTGAGKTARGRRR